MMKMISNLFAIGALLLAATSSLLAATVPEPSTLIYGKVLHRLYGNEHQLTEGSLVWTLQSDTGELYTYTSELENIADTYSYKIDIPHQVLASGLSVDDSVVPLAAGETRYDFVSITLNGSPAKIMWSQSDYVDLLQNSRAETHRIDLEVSFDLTDTDGDGIPDWWEKKYGLDWQIPDGELDSDNDGRENLPEYLGGSDPLNDDTIPSIKSSQLAMFGESANGLWIRSIDIDSQPADLVYTLSSLPEGGSIDLISELGDANELAVGDNFTQAQLDSGLVFYQHSEIDVVKTSFELTLSDGENVSAPTEITLDIFQPVDENELLVDDSSTPDWWRDENLIFENYWKLRQNVLSGDLVESVLMYTLGKDYSWKLWDQRVETLPVELNVSSAGSHFILGGSEDDDLSGGAADDILNGGKGEDRLSGGGGIDLFMVTDLGLETIVDFDFDQDVLDLSDLPTVSTGELDHFLNVTSHDGGSLIGVDVDGDASGFDDAQIKLEGINVSQNDLNVLWSRGQLLLSDIQGQSSVSLVDASELEVEEGYSTSIITLLRQGPISQPLTISLAYSGNATNGQDYKELPDSLTFPANVATVELQLDPIFDGLVESVEQVDIALLEGDGYVLASESSIQLKIVDAKQRFSIQAVDLAAVVNEGPAYMLISRQGPSTSIVQLLLNVNGSAVRGVDYTAINSLVTFPNGQRSVYLPVEALAGGDLGDGEASKKVVVDIKPSLNEDYLIGDSPSASIRLLSNIQDYDSWLEAELANNDDDSGGGSDSVVSPRTGLPQLLEYASSFGLDLSDGVSAEERSALTPQLVLNDSGTYVQYSQRLNDPSLKYTLELSYDMVTWFSGEEYFRQVEISEEEENAGRVCFELLESADATGAYFRVEVEVISE
ncbi:cadherin-like domain-containing protein [Persicirhabdus sediminis]|uniref:Type I secretion C-terminal target domain-containing protein n=1 Tax=Persicirhabdus sediminis TaxID=454144 RepID=A0A8J7MEI8_9BACT|nr:cadherin-like domain-containing protein [Persicirhabdus sediminis]MBK1791225.1 type I secretion C-terminal target domain-containing protein [Persicirhabdus sediminis]